MGHKKTSLLNIVYTGKWSIQGGRSRTRQSWETTTVSSNFRTCKACILCGKAGGYFTHFLTWEVLRNALCTSTWVVSLHLIAVSARLITQKPNATAQKMGRLLSGREVKRKAITPVFQLHPHCSSHCTKLIAPSFECTDNLEAALNVTYSNSLPLLLCSRHYQEAWDALKPLCASCTSAE